MAALSFAHAAALLLACALLTACLIVLLRPLLERYALARPTARSMHKTPTAQGGGIAVIASVLAGCAAAFPLGLAGTESAAQLLPVLAAALGLAVLGALDDLRELAVAPRLLAHLLAAGAVIFALPDDLRLLPALLAHDVERVLLLLAIAWFVNLTNFMDGIDWMTVVETVPVSAAIVAFWSLGWIGAEAGLPALALLGAMLGFAPFNRHVARLFLGDVGSLPIGLLMAWMLVLLAKVSLAAAVLLPLYYLADATLTLLRRLARGERIHEPHRSHYYQQAVARGLSVPQVTTTVFLLNSALAALAAASLVLVSPAARLALVATGVILTGATLFIFARGRP